MTLEDVLKMRNNDIIPLNVPENVSVLVDGVPVMECKSGISNAHYALRVEKMLATETGEAINGGKNG